MLPLYPNTSSHLETCLKKTNHAAGEQDYFLRFVAWVWSFRLLSHTVWSAAEENPIRNRIGGTEEKAAFTLLFSFIHLSNTPAFTSALEAATCGSTQANLMKEPRGRHYNKAERGGGAVLLVWTQGPCLDAHDNQCGPTHLILLQCWDSIQFLHRTSSPAPHEHVFVDRCCGGACQDGEHKTSAGAGGCGEEES